MAIKRFLVVDEVDENRMTMKSVLGGLQFSEVSLTSNGEEALEIMEPKKVEFVILKWEMKPMSGAALCQRLRAKATWRHLPILIYSSKISSEDHRLVSQIGIKNIIPFPIDKDVTSAKIKEIVDAENAVDENERKFRQALAMSEDEVFNDALNLAKECLADQKLRVPAYTLMGHVGILQSDYAQAEESLSQALDLSDGHSPALQLKAKLFSRTERHQEAIDILMSLLNFSPFNIGTLLTLSSVYTDHSQLEEAKETLKEVEHLDPGNPEAQQQQGIIAFKEGDIKLAKEFLGSTNKGLDLARSLNNIAIGLTAKQQFNDGVAAYEAAMEILAGSAHQKMVEYNLGLALKKQGQLGQALEHFANSYCADPSFEKAYAAFVKCIREMKSFGKPANINTIEKIRRVREKFKGSAAA